MRRVCNYRCGFCFHTAKTDRHLELGKAKEGIRMLAKLGLRKLNFAGGEPFLYPDFLGKLCEFCKKVLGLESVSIVTNGSKIKEKWFEKYGSYVDILAVSCDSCDDETNRKIGRCESENGGIAHLNHVRKAAALCDKYGIQFKINTVVNAYNWEVRRDFYFYYFFIYFFFKRRT